MALHIEVWQDPDNPDVFVVQGEWEDGRWWLPTRVVRQPNMSAAESVEWALLLNHQLVPSWRWMQSSYFPNRLQGQFVYGRPDGQLAHKEVRDSHAELFDF